MPFLSWRKRAGVLKKAEEFVSECCNHLNLDKKTLSKDACVWIRRHRWPNDDALELRRIVYSAVLNSTGDVVDAGHFPLKSIKDTESYVGKNLENLSVEKIMDAKISRFFDTMGNIEARGLYKTVLSQVEKSLIERTFEWSRYNKVKTSRILGISRTTLIAKMRKLGICDKNDL